jgi:hypothetical protein
MFGGGISGTQMREIIANDDYNSFAKYVPLKNKKDKQKAWKIMTKNINENIYDREQFLNEMKLRKVIRNIISLQEKKSSESENILRNYIQKVLTESEADKTPHASTAINFLEDLLKKILPTIEQDYKSLTSKQEQRDSFRAQFVSSMDTLINTANVNMAAASEQGQEFIEIEEEIDVEVKEDEKFIDIEDNNEEESEEKEQEAKDTGAKLAAQTFDSVEKQTLDSYSTLSDPEDQKTFQDYLITNLKLYFDKWEKELSDVIEPTTDEYEQEKDEEESDEAEAETAEENEEAEEEGDEDELDLDI